MTFVIGFLLYEVIPLLLLYGLNRLLNGYLDRWLNYYDEEAVLISLVALVVPWFVLIGLLIYFRLEKYRDDTRQRETASGSLPKKRRSIEDASKKARRELAALERDEKQLRAQLAANQDRQSSIRHDIGPDAYRQAAEDEEAESESNWFDAAKRQRE